VTELPGETTVNGMEDWGKEREYRIRGLLELSLFSPVSFLPSYSENKRRCPGQGAGFTVSWETAAVQLPCF
jgi:hypothetical protein